MKKQLLSILLCLIMVVGLLPTAVLAEETAPTFDLTKDLVDIKIPDDLVTCICTTANESKKYGQLPGGFSASKIKKEGDVWTVIISVANETYLKQFNQDMGSTHTQDTAHAGEFITPIQFKLKYEGSKWVPLGEMPQNKMLHFTCGGKHTAQSPAPVLELDFRSINIIKVKPLGNAYEYRIDNGEWQDLHYFENLQPGTEYTITARAKETATHKPGAVSKPLTVATLFDMIPDALKDKLTAVVSAYKAEYDGMEHEAVIVNDTKMPEGWSIAGHTAGTGDDFVSQIPKIRNVSGSNLTIKTKFTHPDYGQSLIVYSYPEITPKPLTAGMIADIPPQLYTGQPILPTPKIKDGDMVLVEGTDFTYSYDTNTSPEHGGKVTITGNGNYKGMASKNFSIVNEITEITEDDLKDLEIPTLVTVKCTTTNSSKEYGRIPGGFTLGTPYMEGGVLKAIVYLNLPAYKDKYDTDTQKTHENAEGEGNPHAAFTLKYVKNKWELDGSFPNVIILVKCDGQHPQTPPHPTEENVDGLEQVQVRVQCSTDRTQFKNYGILPGSVSIMPDPNNPSQATLTLIPSVYSTQYSTDTGITHSVATNQNTDNLKIQMRYDPAVGKWMPAGVLTPLEVLVQCNNHQGQRYTITFKGNGGSPSVTSMTTIDQKLPKLPTATHSGRYSFDGWYTEKNGGTKITTATLFDKDTTVYAHWTYTGSTGGGGVTTYPITVKSAKNGDVTASHKSAAKGTTITLTVDPNKGYVLDTLTVLDGKDKDLKLTEKNGKFTFTMPASKVTVAATFKASTPTGKNPFIDVPAGSYYEDAVIWAVDKGITTGTSATTFNPNGICTRAQAVTFLWRAAGSPAAKSAVMPFTDVKAGSYYYDAVLWAVEQGITKGTSDTMFSPDATCTRAQIVTFLWRSQKSPAAGTANPFADVAADTYYIDAVLWAVKHNITVGTTVSIFSPDEECTRAQIVTFLYRAHNK